MYFTYTLCTGILFVKWNRKALQIFLKTPNNGHKMCEETMRNDVVLCFYPSALKGSGVLSSAERAGGRAGGRADKSR